MAHLVEVAARAGVVERVCRVEVAARASSDQVTKAQAAGAGGPSPPIKSHLPVDCGGVGACLGALAPWMTMDWKSSWQRERRAAREEARPAPHRARA